MKIYAYPDDEDRITAEFITSHEPYPGYWAESETFALKNLEQHLAAQNVHPDRSRRILDVGSGEGRLLPWLGRFAGHIVAQDIDPRRLEKAQKTYPDAAFASGSVYDLPDVPFDMVVCSHVIQHVPTREFTLLLSRLRMLTKPGGILVLAFSRAPVGHEGYFIATLGESHSIDRVHFNSALKTGVAGELPFRLFDPEKLKKTAKRLGWLSEWEWTFHILKDEGYSGMTVEERDGTVNADPASSRSAGRDMMMVWRRGDS
ncbi:MAG TPA: class I SAM-dependent methyltransferase [Candidatus Saccharimonadales bacterium]